MIDTAHGHFARYQAQLYNKMSGSFTWVLWEGLNGVEKKLFATWSPFR